MEKIQIQVVSEHLTWVNSRKNGRKDKEEELGTVEGRMDEFATKSRGHQHL